MALLADDPASLIAEGAPHIIRTDEELAEYTAALFRLTAQEEVTDAEQDTIDLLTLLVREYESKDYLRQPDPIHVVKYLMMKGDLRQQDLQAELGSPSNISMVLSGKRQMTLSNAFALAGRFGLDVRAFLAQPSRLGDCAATTSKRRQMKTKRIAQRISSVPAKSGGKRQAFR